MVCAKGLIAGLTLLVAVALAGPAHASCDAAQTALKSAQRTLDTEDAARIYREAERGVACTGHPLRLLGRNTALIFYGRAFSQDVSESEREALLLRGLQFGRPWQLLAALGDEARNRRAHSRAAQLYQEALDDIRNPKLTPQAPPVEIIRKIHRRAEAASLLAPRYVRRITRAGAPSGLACTNYRGYTVKRTAVPIQFKTDSTEFTDKGRAAATDMRRYLRRQGDPDIHLIGHTDPRGDTHYNQKLSERRANAVAAFLKSADYHGAVRTTGRGETERFPADDPGRYSQDELYQLDRRVELAREEEALCPVAE